MYKVSDYEAIFIIKPDLKEEDLKIAFKSIVDSITKNGGNIKKEESWGKRQLAYPVKKFKEAHYYRVDFSAPPAAIVKLEAAYKLSDETILRIMITKR